MTVQPLRFRPTDRAAAREVAGELVLLDLEEGTFFVARGTGPRVWELLAGGASVEEAAAAVASRYGREDGGRVRAGVEAFAAGLVEKGFLAPQGGP